MESVDLAVELIKTSSSVIALTGAGISTDSGIPDFRSPGGIWSRYPVKFGEYNYFLSHPEHMVALGKELLPLLLQAKPNRGHTALKDLEDMGKLKAVITQNVDGLHQMAGSQNVIEIHGTYKTATCTGCSRTFTVDELLSLMQGLPLCPECSSVIKPDVVMFGEPLPRKAFLEAKTLSEKADLMIVAGSRLEVYPASNLVLVTKGHKGDIIIINNTKTALDKVADVIIRGELSSCLPQVVEKLKKEEKP